MSLNERFGRPVPDPCRFLCNLGLVKLDGWMLFIDVVHAAVAAVASVEVSVLELDGVWFEWSLLIVYMYLQHVVSIHHDIE